MSGRDTNLQDMRQIPSIRCDLRSGVFQCFRQMNFVQLCAPLLAVCSDSIMSWYLTEADADD